VYTGEDCGGSASGEATKLSAIDIPEPPSNNPPVANNDSYNATEDTQLVVLVAAGVLFNDTDVEGNSLTAVKLTNPTNGTIDEFLSDGSFKYTPAANYCGTDSFTYKANDSLADSGSATVTINVACVNDPPDFDVISPINVFEDNGGTGANSDVAVTENFDTGADNEDQDVAACEIDPATIADTNTPVVLKAGTLSIEVNGAADACQVDFTTELNNYGSFSFKVRLRDTGDNPVEWSEWKTVNITVQPVNDPPYVVSVTAAEQTVQYSDYIDQVTILVRDVDSEGVTLTLDTTGEPNAVNDAVLVPDSCHAWSVDHPYTGEGRECTFTMDGQVQVPGDDAFVITFTPNDTQTDGTTKTHTLTVEPEDAVVHLDKEGDANPVAIEVVDSDTDPTNKAFTMYFWAFELNSTPFGAKADNWSKEPAGTGAGAVDGDFVDPNVKGYISFNAVGPGPGASRIPCTFIKEDEEGDGLYGDYMVFECDIPAGTLGVNTYEVLAEVDGEEICSDAYPCRYFYGYDEDAFVVYDPNAGFTTAGGWFYWPGTELEEGAQYLPPGGEEGFDEIDNPCAPYLGDKTNFGYTMKYNRKGNKVQGSALVMRHPMVPLEIEPDVWACLEGEKYRVKSNALYGLAIAGDDTYGFASFAGKAVYREPGMETNEGNHTFIIYAEDHGEQGCGQDPSDRFWVEVWNKDDVPVMLPLMGSPAYNWAANVVCGNVVVPH